MERVIIKFADDQIALLEQGPLQPEVIGGRNQDPLLDEDPILTGQGPAQVGELDSRPGHGTIPGIVARNWWGSSIRTSLPITEPSSDQRIIRRGGLIPRTALTTYCTARVRDVNRDGSIPERTQHSRHDLLEPVETTVAPPPC